MIKLSRDFGISNAIEFSYESNFCSARNFFLLGDLNFRDSLFASSVLAEYEAIAERALTPPPNTAALMKLIKFVQTTSDVTLKSLELRLLDVIEHIAFLSDYWLLTESEISNNSTAFQWYHRMPQILDDSRLIIENKTQEYQDALRG